MVDNNNNNNNNANSTCRGERTKNTYLHMYWAKDPIRER